MRLINLALILSAVLLALAAEESPKNRGKRQGLSYHPRRIGKPPPYAVPMEPTVRYSQRDPLYKPLISVKSDDFSYEEPLHHPASPHGYGPTEPEPIIEIIIKESNETLPTPVPPTYPPARPTKEPIQVFYVKYEKKDQGDGKSKVVYDTPVPAIVPHEEHEEIKDDKSDYEPEPASYVTAAPTSKEPTTTLRAIIRPESESYHAGGSGIRVTFGTDQLPPNNHHKRSDLEKISKNLPPPATPPRPTSRKQHGPSFPPPPSPLRGVPPAFGQSRIVNSFPPHLQLTPSLQAHYQGPPQRRPPITIQGLPEVQQRQPFQQPFGQPHRIQISHPQQPGFPPALSVSHQSVHVQSQPPQFSQGPASFNDHAFHQHQVQLYRQQEEEKLRYHQDQRRQQELQRQQEVQRQKDIQRQQEVQRQQELQRQKDLQRQQELQRQKDIQRQQELQRQQEYQRIKQENQIREHQQQIHQQQQFNQSPNFPTSQHQLLLNNRVPPQQPEKQSEILKAVPKLEQHYAIRENPNHPGPFPPNAQQVPLQFSQNAQSNYAQQQAQRPNSIGIQQSNHGNFVSSTNAPLSQSFDPSIGTSRHQSSQQFFSENLGVAHQQPQQLQQLASVWGRPVYKDSKQKIYATPVTHTTPAPPPSTLKLTTTTTTPTTTTTTTTEAPTTPRNEAKIKENIANLPDEVPEDIRAQLLSSGILGNADIQVLDYDKIGDIPIENLPPDALANFYGAGGGGVVSASEPIPSVVKPHRKSPISTPKKVTNNKVEQATLKPGGVEMKVVRFDPNTAQGQAIADQHIREDATQLKPVTVGSKNDGQYNRYLPLKVSGTSFPIPDVPELKDRKITSVVVLAPVDYNGDVDEEIRDSRKLGEPMPVKFLAGESLKQLIRTPSAENYKRWLEQERRSEPQKQSVVLLVTTAKDPSSSDKEIFMYDVTSQTVSRLSGDLSSAFVDAAESNADSHDSIDDSVFAQ